MNKLFVSGVAALALAAGGVGGYLLLQPPNHLAQARTLLAHGDVLGASLELRGAVLSNPANAEAHFRLGLIDLQLGNAIAAETELTAARDHGWAADLVRAPLAQALVAQGRNADVLKHFNADGLAPDQAAALLATRSAAELGLGHVKAARAEAEAARRRDPRSARAALAVARAAQAGGDIGTATQAVAQALSLDPHAGDALVLDAELRGRRGDIQGALTSLGTAIADAPLWAAPRLGRAQLLVGLQRDAEARPDIAALLQQDPQSAAANYLLAEVLARAGDYADADAALGVVGLGLPQMPRGEYLQAVVKANLNQPEPAMDAASSYLAHAPQDPDAYKLVARLDLAAHQPGQAVQVLARATASGRADAETLILLSTADSQAGRPEAAVADMQKLAALRPNDPAILARLGELRLAAGDASGAVDDLSHALDHALDLAAPAAPARTLAIAAVPAAGEPGKAASAPPLAPVPPPAAGQAPAAGPRPASTTATTTATASRIAGTLVTAALRAGEPERAAAALERLRALGGDPAQLALLDGEVKLEKLAFAAALAAFEEARRLDPTSVTPAVQMARVLVLQGRRADAETTLAAALAAHPGNREALSADVAILMAEGKTDQAIAAMLAARAAAPGDVSVGIALSDLYVRARQPARALALLDSIEKARAAPPTLLSATDPGGKPSPSGSDAAESPAIGPALLAARSRALVAAGRRREAIAIVRQLLARQPDELALRTQLVGLMLGEGDVAGAHSVIQEGLARQPGNPAMLNAEVAAAAAADGTQSGLDLADRLAQDPANGVAGKLLKGNLLLARKQYWDAAAAFATYIQPDAPPVFAIRAAQALVADGRTADAAQLLRDWLARHPDTPDAAMLLASLDLGAHQTDDARRLFQNVLAKQPNDPAALNNLAWIEQQQHELPSALQLAQRSWLLAPSPQTADTLGWILLQSGDAAPAVDLLRLAAEDQGSNPTVQFHYAMALKQAGQPDAAKAILTRLAALPADFDAKPDARKALDAAAPAAPPGPSQP